MSKYDISGIYLNNYVTFKDCHDDYYADNLPVYELERCPKSAKVDIFETLNLLIFPYDPIRDWTKKKVTEINERFKPLEKALGI